MTGTPRSYALDPDVVRFLDSLPDGRKRPNPFSKRHYASSRSKTVSEKKRDERDEFLKISVFIDTGKVLTFVALGVLASTALMTGLAFFIK